LIYELPEKVIDVGPMKRININKRKLKEKKIVVFSVKNSGKDRA
jgi:hypothetical protein